MNRSHLPHPDFRRTLFRLGERRTGEILLQCGCEHTLSVFDADCIDEAPKNSFISGTFCGADDLIRKSAPTSTTLNDELRSNKPPASPESRSSFSKPAPTSPKPTKPGKTNVRVKAWLKPLHDSPDQTPTPPLKRGTFRGQAPREMKLLASVWRETRRTIGYYPAESGGFLGGNRKDYLVNAFCFDRTARRTGATYTPDHVALNALLSDEWNPQEIDFLGFAHSHPRQFDEPSEGDLIYAARILAALPNLPYLLLPIIIPASRISKFRIEAYAIGRSEDLWSLSQESVLNETHGVRIFRLDLTIVQDELPDILESAPVETPLQTSKSSHSTSIVENSCYQEESVWTALVERWPLHLAIVLTVAALAMWFDFWSRSGLLAFSLKSLTLPPGRFEAPTVEAGVPSHKDEAFSRVEEAYDLPHLAQCRVIYAGVGGAAMFAEDMARAGVGEHYLIDPDTVSLPNIATQQVYRRDVGRLKVECIGERIHDINPNARLGYFSKPTMVIEDSEWHRIIRMSHILPFCTGGYSGPGAFSPKATLLCGLTDDFEAQAHINRVALHFGIPSLCAQVYREGRGAEISFTVPGVTPACHRCALASRYQAHLQGGFENDVTSHGTPIFATTRLNALKGFIALAILHHGTNHPRWGGLIERIGDRNLVLLRLDPDIAQTLGLTIFDRVLGSSENSVLFDEAIWRPQKPDNPSNSYPFCPDCGGTGDLRDAIGTFDSTLPMRF